MAQAAEGRVRDARHRREDDRRPHLERPDLQRRGPGHAASGHTAVHRSVTATPSSASRMRISGSDRPRTVPWSPSIPSTNGAP
jgi:hypothetical protein